MPATDEPLDQACEQSPEASLGATIPPGLTLVATPIGNLGDISARALAALRSADLVLCEDTRTTARLLRHHGIEARTEALHEHNEDARTPGLLARMAAGARVALVSDAGTPIVSDPGFRLVRAAVAAGLHVGVVPGANAAVTALVLSGLPPSPFLFLGFPPPREAARQATFAKLRAAERAGLSTTFIWHEAPHRLGEMLADLRTVFGERPAAVARELTKRFEEIRRGTLDALISGQAADPARGEITVVLGPAVEGGDAEDLDGRLLRALAEGSMKDAAAMVATATGLPRKVVYARALELARPPSG